MVAFPSVPGRPMCLRISGHYWRSTLAPSSSQKPEAYLSTSQSPLFNLSLEEHLLRTRPPDVPLLLIYRNSPCIVIGRNQNPWKELNVAAMHRLNLPLVRRRSGGGAVYHDLGNSNFSFHIARERFERRRGVELIARALNGPGIGLRSIREDEPVPSAHGVSVEGRGSPEGVVVNDRHDLVVRVASQAANSAAKDSAQVSQRWSWSERKISGSAFKILTHKAYHHGTMLLSSNLSALGSTLRNVRSAAIISKGVESVKSPVTNLCEAFPDAAASCSLTHENFAEAVIREFWRTYGAQSARDETTASQEGIGWTEIGESHAIAQEAKRVELERGIGTWDWIFGQCPEFETTVSLSDFAEAEGLRQLSLTEASLWIRAKDGIVIDAEARSINALGAEEEWRSVFRGLIGRRYDQLTDRPPLPSKVEMSKESKPTEQIAISVDRVGSGDAKHAALLRWLRKAL